jgi:hypothetical protein
VSGAHNALLDLEELEEADLERFRAREALGRGELDTGTPKVRPGLAQAGRLNRVGQSGQTTNNVKSVQVP